jgi:hypothetical protein
MNKFVQESIDTAIKDSGCILQGLSPLESKFFRQKLSDKYALGNIPESLFWEEIKADGFAVCEKKPGSGSMNLFRNKNVISFLRKVMDSQFLFFQKTNRS